MNRRWMTMLAFVASGSLQAAPKACDELKAEIEAKIQAAGVASYTLEIVPASEVRDPGMVVGSCENGSRRIIYQNHDDY